MSAPNEELRDVIFCRKNVLVRTAIYWVTRIDEFLGCGRTYTVV